MSAFRAVVGFTLVIVAIFSIGLIATHIAQRISAHWEDEG